MEFRPKLLLCLFAISMGGAVLGIDGGIVATVIAQPSFKSYMFGPDRQNSDSLLGIVVSIGSAGGVIGSLGAGFMLDHFGRRQTLSVSTVFALIGGFLQTVANGVFVMSIGRLVAGIGLGLMGPTISVYISELAKPTERARSMGIYGLIVAVGFCLANWIGYACSFAKGELSWRSELATQVPLAAALLTIVRFLPESPRWLAQTHQFSLCKQTIRQIYGDDNNFVEKTAREIREQIANEELQGSYVKASHALLDLFSLRHIKQTLLAVAVLQASILSGSLAIQNYQSILYKELGYEGRGIMLISGYYGFMGIAGQVINICVVSDRWPRVRTLWVGCLVLSSMLAITAGLSKEYRETQNIYHARAGIAFIFLYSALYAVFFNSTLSTVVSEMFPQHLRGYGTGTASFFQGISAILVGQVTPAAFSAIGYKFYFVFIFCLLCLATLFKFALVELNGVPLENVSAKIGNESIPLNQLGSINEENSGLLEDDI